MISNTRAIQLSDQRVEVSWLSTTVPVAGFNVERETTTIPLLEVAVVQGNQTVVIDSTVEAVAGDLATYHVTDLDSSTGEVVELQLVDLDEEFTNAPPDPLASVPRYTDLATVKRRLRIPTANTDFDEDLTEAIVAAEIALDYELGQSFPSTGDNPQYAGIPKNVRTLCTSAAIAVYKAADAPLGTAGSDDWFGALTIADVASQTIRRSPLIRGLQLSFGIG